ncbi:MAG: hypothetical protein IJR60_04265 [Eubacterium sp.]|nr:hypothetical protein [Eubacterium sp.]
MGKFAKALATFINLCTYGVGIAVVLIKLLHKDFIAVFIISGFNYNESLFFNMALFCLGTMLLGVVLTMLVGEYNRDEVTVMYPIVWAIIPAVITCFFIYFGVTGAAAREIAIMLASAAVYLASSLVNIYTGTKVFTLYPNKNKKSDDE